MRAAYDHIQRTSASLALFVGVLIAIATAAGLAHPATSDAAPTAVPGSASPAEFVVARTDGLARTGRAADPWRWSAAAQAWGEASAVLPAGLVSRGPTARISRGQFLAALLAVEALRDAQSSDGWQANSSQRSSRLLHDPRPAPALLDAHAGSARARAVAYGWMTARAGRFEPRAPITANDAALAMAGMLGLRPSVVSLALRLRRDLPGARIGWTYASAHAISRTLGLRYNVETGSDHLELGPAEAVNVAHGAYMLHMAATSIPSWKLAEAQQLAATFALPALGSNQRRVLITAARQLGQPYVWAGETEGQQAEGHGGFDCSGFAIRVINQSGVRPDQIATINERTSYTQSAIGRGQRIGRAQLQPGDAMFFGSRGPLSAPGENYHVGVYMGNGWFIHSSGGNAGVAINSLDGWWGGQFAWGRRALTSA